MKIFFLASFALFSALMAQEPAYAAKSAKSRPAAVKTVVFSLGLARFSQEAESLSPALARAIDITIDLPPECNEVPAVRQFPAQTNTVMYVTLRKGGSVVVRIPEIGRLTGKFYRNGDGLVVRTTLVDGAYVTNYVLAVTMTKREFRRIQGAAEFPDEVQATLVRGAYYGGAVACTETLVGTALAG